MFNCCSVVLVDFYQKFLQILILYHKLMKVFLTDIIAYSQLSLGGEGGGVGKLLAGVGVVDESHLLSPGPHIPG